MTSTRADIERIYREESRRVLASLIRLLQGNFDLAEEAMHDAFIAALAQWPDSGIPTNPRAWLVSAGRFKAIDRLRQRACHDASLALMATEVETTASMLEDAHTIADDPLRLIFTCCHPDLMPEARLALTLREVCGLTTEQIAAAFLVPPPTLAQRIVRAKARIRDAGIPYEVPAPAQLPERLSSVLQVIYLVFNEGYSASNGDSLARHELCSEALRLGEQLAGLLHDSEVMGLLALMLLHDARAAARTTPGGELIPLEEQDRRKWNQPQIKRGCAMVLEALRKTRAGPYLLQAAIAAVHAEADSAGDTDWHQIVGLYEVLMRRQPTPVVALNHAVAIAMLEGPAHGLASIDRLIERGGLKHYHLAWAARGDLHRRLNRRAPAIADYRQAIALAEQGPERRYLQRRLAALEKLA